MQRIAQESEGPIERICGHVVHLRVFNAASCESGLLKLPTEMFAAIFKHMTKRGFVFRISKIVKDRVPQCHIHHVSETVEIWRSADDGSAGSQHLLKTFQNNVGRYG